MTKAVIITFLVLATIKGAINVENANAPPLLCVAQS